MRKLSHVHAQNVATLKGAGIVIAGWEYWQEPTGRLGPRFNLRVEVRAGLYCACLFYISTSLFWDAYLIESSASLTAHGGSQVTGCCPVTSREGAMDRGGFPRSVKRLVSDGIGSPDRPEWHAFAGNSKLLSNATATCKAID